METASRTSLTRIIPEAALKRGEGPGGATEACRRRGETRMKVRTPRLVMIKEMEDITRIKVRKGWVLMLDLLSVKKNINKLLDFLYIFSVRNNIKTELIFGKAL